MIRRLSVALALIFIGLPVLYVGAAALLTAFPVNAGRDRPLSGIEIFVSSNGAHADIIMPIAGPTWDWRRRIRADSFLASMDTATHIAFGWGDRAFYLETPTWSDLTVANALPALFWPSASVVHVSLLTEPESLSGSYRILLEPAQFRALSKYIEASFAVDEKGRVILVAGARYTPRDAFFEGTGAYTLLNTCNNWAGRALKYSGVPVGRWTPFDFNLLYHLESD